MAQIFSKSANMIPVITLLLIILLVLGGISFFWYYGSPKFTDVGYRPDQPVDYSHKLHAGDLGMDCRYCHYQVEKSRHSNIPPTKVCMNCHSLIGLDKETLDPVRESFANNTPIEWIRVHNLPEYAYFDHSLHLRSGVACIECHGNVAMMEKVQQVEPLSMGWCLDCHRDPASHLRPPSQVTNMYWSPPKGHDEWAQSFIQENQINPPEDCSACHR
ncbi:MAG TPA: cytochrome C [Bacteroidetes bacterium]|nr:class III cytochrome C family protein [bacterium BMS3Bbin04]HDO65519.1 cytochrome C [Bacteroidota bacterium]HEX04644.1 cytochrome C [Bacteroidota bacterium]